MSPNSNLLIHFKLSKNILVWIHFFFLSLSAFYVLQRVKEGDLLVPDRLFKVVLVGNSSVGKTSLLRSFCEGRFHPSTTATVGEKRNTAVVLLWFVYTKVSEACFACVFVDANTKDLRATKHHMKGLVKSHCLS